MKQPPKAAGPSAGRAGIGAAQKAELSRAELVRRLEEIGYRLEDHNAHIIRLAHQRSSSLFQKAFEGLSITPTQVAVLATLLRHGDLPQNLIGKYTAIDTATLSPMLKRMELAGWVERIPSEADQRVNLIHLTPHGQSFALEVLPISQRVSDEVLAPLNARDRKRFVELLRKLT
ncbi:MarR family winged helix-turn-helix transcriptional regulator [Hoeflea sp.]|uniref:MarR family winged helix-turn-helix transcriptional regulator n=1 Tax=Hoeflea sp. TaxID=1940281 RepID=UPI0019CAA2C5|nr:MarR family winged helix-turn-helix transcriptional regulator [Hoeflea sp.]MBC7281061.1 winged helix-turn-helix transcriptional regulator [Hoeflea sp.]